VTPGGRRAWCTGVILAGGAASRFRGRPKGLELVAGERIIDRVARALAAATDSLLLVANDDAADAWLPGVPRRSDIHRGLGALGGIHAALVHARSPVIVVAWDMPFVPAALLTELREAGEASDVVVPESGSPRGVEPLCAWYAPACIPAIERRIAADDRRAVGFHDDVRVTRLPAPAVARHGDPGFIFMNVNTPADLALAEEHALATHGRRDRTKA
jgi:molybdopterin-guanine dinucleotide biosynthesis protein A